MFLDAVVLLYVVVRILWVPGITVVYLYKSTFYVHTYEEVQLLC